MSEPHPAAERNGSDSSFIERHAAAASALGEQLADLITDPASFERTLKAGLGELVDPASLAMQAVVAPDVTTTYAVRRPLLDLVKAPVRRALAEASSASALWLAQQLVDADHRDLRLWALLPLRRCLRPDPELAWQLLRRMAGRAGDWIEVDALADPWARGILAEPFRWAELEQLVYSRRVQERRLVGATLATLPHRVPMDGRAGLRGQASRRALDLVRMLMGDAEPLVQKALAWAIREWTPIDPDGVARLLREETALATRGDGARAWVIRETLDRQPASMALELRSALAGVRRQASAASTSPAAATSARFAPLLRADQEGVIRQGDRYLRSRP